MSKKNLNTAGLLKQVALKNVCSLRLKSFWNQYLLIADFHINLVYNVYNLKPLCSLTSTSSVLIKSIGSVFESGAGFLVLALVGVAQSSARGRRRAPSGAPQAVGSAAKGGNDQGMENDQRLVGGTGSCLRQGVVGKRLEQCHWLWARLLS